MSAYTYRSKRLGYDNIATGSATGMERHVAGGGGIETTREKLDTLGVSADCVNSSFIANRPLELELGANLVSDANLSGHNAANPTSIVDITPTSATTPGWTSGTSWTSAIHELNTAI